MINVDIISGFLGAGKTTFIKKMVEEVYSGEKVVIIENEFGEIGIDSGFLKDSGIQVSELNSGCICCTLVGDFEENLVEVIETYKPDRILVEPSGVGKLSDVMTSVSTIEKKYDIKLGALVTIVNALKASKQMKAFGEFFNNQIEYATTVILSRTQSATPDQLEFCTTQIQKLNPKAAVITTPWDDITGQQIFEVIEGRDNLELKVLAEAEHAAHEAMHAHDHDHDHEHHHDHDHDHDHEHEHHDHEHEHHHDHDHEHEHHHDHDHEHEHHHDHDHEHHHDHDHHHHDHDHDHHGHHHHDHHHADEIFDSWGKETPHIFTKDTIEGALKAFVSGDEYGEVIRSKGMVNSDTGEWIYFDLVDGEYEVRSGAPDYTGRLVVIGVGLKEDKLEELFGLK